jgi:Aspartyl protease
MLLLALLVIADARKPAFVPAHPRLFRVKPTRVASTIVSQEPTISISGQAAISHLRDEPLLDTKMQKLKLPMMAVGKEYVAIPLKIDNQGPFRFMLDTGLTAQAMVTPRLMRILHFEENKDFSTAEGLAAGGQTGKVQFASLSGVALCGPSGTSLTLPCLEAVISNFAQETMDRQHPVAGMLGMELLDKFDVDFDFPEGRVRFWEAGTAEKEARRHGMVEIPIAVINNSLLLGIRVTGNALGDKKESSGQQQKQPFLGILDTGSTFSAVNWKAAQLLGLPPKKSMTYLKPPAIVAMGIDNKPLYVPTKKIEFTFSGNAITNEKGVIVGFSPPSPGWKRWKPVLAGIGDLPIFELLLGTDNKPYQGPAALIGMDVLSQRRVILESIRSGSDSRKWTGRMFVSPE